MTEYDLRVQSFVSQAEQLVASHAPEAARLALAKDALQYEDMYRDGMEQWAIDQIDFLPNFLGLGFNREGILASGEQVGTAAVPNRYTTKAADMKDPLSAALDSKKVFSDLSEGFQNATSKAINELAKALTTKVIIFGTIAAGVGGGLYFYSNRRRS